MRGTPGDAGPQTRGRAGEELIFHARARAQEGADLPPADTSQASDDSALVPQWRALSGAPGGNDTGNTTNTSGDDDVDFFANESFNGTDFSNESNESWTPWDFLDEATQIFLDSVASDASFLSDEASHSLTSSRNTKERNWHSDAGSTRHMMVFDVTLRLQVACREQSMPSLPTCPVRSGSRFDLCERVRECDTIPLQQCEQ